MIRIAAVLRHLRSIIWRHRLGFCLSCGRSSCNGGFNCPKWPRGWGNPL